MAGEPVFKPNENIDEEARGLPIIASSAEAAAEQIAEIARSSAPHESGDYAAGIVVQKTKTGARVFASDYKSAWIEFGVPSQGKPARFNLRRAVEAAGFRFKKGH
jgi:hypothetical protein